MAQEWMDYGSGKVKEAESEKENIPGDHVDDERR